MKKLLVLVVGIIFLLVPVFADNEITMITQENSGIGTVHQYKIGENTYVGVNFNLETLYLATETGSGFTHPGYTVQNEFFDAIKS